MLVPNQSVQSARRTNNDVGELVLVLQELDVFGHRRTTIEDGGLDIWQIFAESCILVLDLEGQLSGVAHDENLALTRNRVERVQRG